MDHLVLLGFRWESPREATKKSLYPLLHVTGDSAHLGVCLGPLHVEELRQLGQRRQAPRVVDAAAMHNQGLGLGLRR